MKKKSNISFGPGAASLILVFIVLSMSVLAMLSFMNAHNDRALSQRNAAVIGHVYALNSEAERSRAVLDEILCELKQNCSSQDEYLSTLKLVLDALQSTNEGDEYDALADALAFTAGGTENSNRQARALKILAKLSENRADFAVKLKVLGDMNMDGDVIRWSQTDASDELAISESVYGLRTLECELKVLPLNEAGRSQWISYRLITTLADDKEQFFGD